MLPSSFEYATFTSKISVIRLQVQRATMHSTLNINPDAVATQLAKRKTDHMGTRGQQLKKVAH